MTNTNTAKTETKTETPKLANPFAAFTPPFAPTFDVGQMYAQAADQFAAFEKEMIARTQAAVATWAQLAQDAIAYAGQLATEARKLSTDAAKKMTAS